MPHATKELSSNGEDDDFVIPSAEGDVKLSRLTSVKVERITSELNNSGLDPSADSVPADVERWLTKHGKFVPKKLNK